MKACTVAAENSCPEDLYGHAKQVPSIPVDTPLESVLEHFREDHNRAYFPITDDSGVPLGLLHERSLKEYVFARYGIALLRRQPLRNFITDCPTLDIGMTTDNALRQLGFQAHEFGAILTRKGRYAGFLPNTAIFELYEKNRQAVEQQLNDMQKLQAIGSLAGGMAHELNNLLVPINGFAELLLDNHSKEHRLATQILDAGQRSADIIRQILDFSRSKSARQTLTRMSRVIDETLELLRATLPQNIDIRFEDQTTSDVIRGNANQLKQVLMNLCTNASHAMESQSGTISIRLETRPLPTRFTTNVSEFSGLQHLHITVSDTGCGIRPEHLKRIFEPFFTTKRHDKGTGLGLAVVQGIIATHHGLLEVDSDPGTGTTVHIYLPQLENEENEDRPAPLMVPEGNEQLLVVDDEPAIVGFIVQALESYGYRVVSTTDSKHALQLFREDPQGYDLVISDQLMPGMYGTELIRNLRHERPDLPAIIFTGFSNALKRTPGQDFSKLEVLRKPLERADLGSAVARALGKNQPRELSKTWEIGLAIK